MDQLFSPKHHSLLKKKLIYYYQHLLTEIKTEKLLPLGQNFKKELFEILKDNSLKKYSPLKFFWIKFIEDYFFLKSLENEEEIFEYFETSEFCDDFFKQINKNLSIKNAFEKISSNIEKQILSFYYLHLNSKSNNPKNTLQYKIIPEIGDFNQRIYLTDTHSFISFKNPLKGNQLAIKSISKDSIKINSSSFRIFQPIPKIYKNRLTLVTTCKEGIKKFEEFKLKIEKALKIIKKYSPESYYTFLSFTHTILPVNEPGVVSYSLQNLPGYSSINFFERDFIDLLDDLIHENGHHYLNTYLNFMDLINEDEEKIYYSPWRRSLRPIRGIYHAFFTFFWALHLFGNLFKNLNRLDFFDEGQKKKIASRFIEEYLMLIYCIPDLKHAYKNKKITASGMKLINQIYAKIKIFKSLKKDAFKYLGNDPKLFELKSDLEAKRKQYHLS